MTGPHLGEEAAEGDAGVGWASREPKGYTHTLEDLYDSAWSTGFQTRQFWLTVAQLGYGQSPEELERNRQTIGKEAEEQEGYSLAEWEAKENEQAGIDQSDRFYTQMAFSLRHMSEQSSALGRMKGALRLVLLYLSSALKQDPGRDYKNPQPTLGAQTLRKRELLANATLAKPPGAVRRGDSAAAAFQNSPIVQPSDSDCLLYVQEQATFECLQTSEQYLMHDQGVHCSMKVSTCARMVQHGKTSLRMEFDEPSFERQAIFKQPAASYIELGGASGVPGVRGEELPESRRETYVFNLPNLQFMDILRSDALIHWVGSTTILCPETRLMCRVDFPNFLSSFKVANLIHAVAGTINSLDDESTLATFGGALDEKIRLEIVDTGELEVLHDDRKSMRTRPCVTSACTTLHERPMLNPNRMLLRKLWSSIVDAVHEGKRLAAFDLDKNYFVQPQTEFVQTKKDQARYIRHQERALGLRWQPEEFHSTGSSGSLIPNKGSEDEQVRLDYEFFCMLTDIRPCDETPRLPPVGPEFVDKSERDHHSA